MEKQYFEDLLLKNPKHLTEKQKSFIRYVRIKEEFEAGLDGF